MRACVVTADAAINALMSKILSFLIGFYWFYVDSYRQLGLALAWPLAFILEKMQS
jgi:hypothetical protein